MDPTVLFISISLMFMLTLLLVGTIYSRLHWVTKAFFIVFSLAVITMDYRVLTNALGWPVMDQLPDTVQIMGVDIREPAHGSKGEIYVWYMTSDQIEPRNVQIPYSKEMHKKMAKAQAMLAKGQKVHMSRFKQGVPGQAGKQGQQGEPGVGRRGQSNFQSPGPLDFIPPPDAAPMKDAYSTEP